MEPSTKQISQSCFTSWKRRFPHLEEIPNQSARACDRMCLIQQSPTGLGTFGQLSDYILKRITSNPSKLIFFITGQYWEISIKGGEQDKRSKGGTKRIIPTREDQKLPTQMKKFLALGTNKTELIKFLLKDWRTGNRHLNTLRNKTIYFSCGDQV